MIFDATKKPTKETGAVTGLLLKKLTSWPPSKEQAILQYLTDPKCCYQKDATEYIVKVHGTGSDWIVMDCLRTTFLQFYFDVEGASLNLKGKFVKMDVERASLAWTHITDILRGLLCICDSGILYRDLHPRNICLDEHGKIKFIDFGAAMIWDSGSEEGFKLELEKFFENTFSKLFPTDPEDEFSELWHFVDGFRKDIRRGKNSYSCLKTAVERLDLSEHAPKPNKTGYVDFSD